MDDVELECYNLLQSIGLAPAPAPASPPTLSRALGAAGPLAGEQNGRPNRVEDQTTGDGTVEQNRGIRKNTDREWREETSTSRRSDSIQPTRAVSHSPSKYYDPSRRAFSPPRRDQNSSPARYSSVSSQDRRRSRSPRRPSESTSDASAWHFNFSNLYLKDLDSSVSSDDLRSLFEPFGVIEDVRTRVANGLLIGFVGFRDHSGAKIALRELDNKMLGSKQPQISYAVDEAPAPPCRTLIVSSIDPTIPQTVLKNAFEEHGVVHSITRHVPEDARKGVIAFVSFKEQSDSTRAREATNGLQLGSLRLEVRFSNQESWELGRRRPKSLKSPSRRRRGRSRSPVDGKYAPGEGQSREYEDPATLIVEVIHLPSLPRELDEFGRERRASSDERVSSDDDDERY